MVGVREAADLVGRTPETVRRWVWSGRLEARRDGNRLLLRRSDVVGLGEGQDPAAPLSLLEWAKQAKAAQRGARVGTSAADLVLDDRAEREAPDARR